MRKQLSSDLSRLAVTEMINGLIQKKKSFSFHDIEKEYNQPLTAADKFLIRCVIVKKFNLKIEYLSSSSTNQLQFCRS
ncbi:hypothetical protein A5844_002662 [Enterococcus sp. 10A9_DIV0425]|uniref:Uncharacterized protein n=1 Tax=Candidatus Enterococcus wittei TaxID=1987383 RepID=A0A242JVM9_9ENTE|nr:hypothetical protein [Enterococcus sp. 10A9_DIV0425]OTP06956.1 hypothetical protein A5844_002662 [Enterococcus sp. 10A9_DIV0425]THE12688.1 hypothetical protein E1H99_07110 [Enterococcus hirae]